MQFLRTRKTTFVATVLAAFVMGGALAAAAQQEVTIHSDTPPFPESLVGTPDGTLYINSFPGNKVFRAPHGSSTAELWITPDKPGIVQGLVADLPTNTLWVCHNGPFDAKHAPAGTPELLAYDLKTGKKKTAYQFPMTTGTGMCNDSVIAADGTLYVTETTGGQIFRLKKGASALELWVKDDQIAGIDGIVKNGSNLYVNTFASGKLLAVPIKADGSAGTITELTLSTKITHPDGFRPLKGNTFLLVEGVGRLDKVTIEGNNAKIDLIKDGYDSPTSATLIGNNAWVTEGKLEHMNDPNNKSMAPFVLHPVKVQ